MKGFPLGSQAGARLASFGILVSVACGCLALAASSPAMGAGVTVSTVAGSAGASGDVDGTAAKARFSGPYAVACDSAGNVYVADTGNHSVRKITPSGDVSTLVRANAGLQYPQGVACDTAGNLYVADTYNHIICKILPGGGLTTLAGLSGEQGTDDGVGTAARFCYPAGLACDTAGNLYVADSGNGEVRKVTPGGAVTTVAVQDLGLDSPQSVAVGPDGALYVADAGGDQIVRLAGGRLAVLAGPADVSYPGGVACDAGGTVYVADTDDDCVRRGDGAGVPVLAGSPGASGSADGSGPDARFSAPQGITCDAAGNVYVADTGNDTVRKLSVDSLAPVTSVSPALARDATSGWRTSGVTLTLSAGDAGSGTAGTFYSIDGGGVVPYAIPFMVGTAGSHRITYYSVDVAGNEEAPRTGYVNIDQAPPVTTDPPLGGSPSSAWVSTAQTVTLTATDDLSGVALTRYSIDAGPVKTYVAPFAIGADGSHVVAYSSVDVAGNAETTHTAYVNIDDTPPVTKATPSLADGPTTGWRNAPLKVTLSAGDAGAGVAATHYAIDGTPAVVYVGPFSVGGTGSHQVAWSSVDLLGAVETTRTGYVNIDTSVPVTTAKPASVRSGGQVTLRFRVDDAAPSCGSASVTIQVKRGGKTIRTFTLGSRPVNASLGYRLKAALPKGAYTWRVPATDAAGNRAVRIGSAKLTVR